jgi:hypothetical protein
LINYQQERLPPRMIFKNPCFFAEGGEKEEKSRGKMKKLL